MAWDGIRKTGSLCLMMVFLATGVASQGIPADEDLREEVRVALTGAGKTSRLGELKVANSDIAIWNIYVEEFSIANPPGLPDPGFTYCVVSRTNNDSECNNPLPPSP